LSYSSILIQEPGLEEVILQTKSIKDGVYTVQEGSATEIDDERIRNST